MPAASSAQREVALPAGTTASAAARALHLAGVPLLAEVLAAIEAGTAPGRPRRPAALLPLPAAGPAAGDRGARPAPGGCGGPARRLAPSLARGLTGTAPGPAINPVAKARRTIQSSMPLLPPAPPRRFLFLQGPDQPLLRRARRRAAGARPRDAADQPLPGRPAVLAGRRGDRLSRPGRGTGPTSSPATSSGNGSPTSSCSASSGPTTRRPSPRPRRAASR